MKGTLTAFRLISPKRKKAGSEPKMKRITARATRFEANWRTEIVLNGDF
jgi:phosphoserine phosphatase